MVRDLNAYPVLSKSIAADVKLPGSKNDVPPRERMFRHPLIRQREGESVRRRQAFLRKVKEASDDRKWQTRSDQVC